MYSYDVSSNMQFVTVFEKKYKKDIQMIKNACERRISDLLVPTIPSDSEIEGCLHDLLQKRGVNIKSTMFETMTSKNPMSIGSTPADSQPNLYIPSVNSNGSSNGGNFFPTLYLVC